MAILVNIGSRGFILKEGMLAPTEQITVEQETAEKLSRMYPKELKIVVTEKVVKEEPKAQEVKEVKEEPKKTSRKKSKS